MSTREAATVEPDGTHTDTEASPDKRSIILVFVGLMITMLSGFARPDDLQYRVAHHRGRIERRHHMVWVTTAYILASTVMMPVYGKLGDLIGRKGLFIGAISIFIVGSVIGGLSHDMTTLIAGRAVQGLGGGGLILLSQAIIADVVPARQRGRYMGAMGGVFALASVAGPLLGGWFTEGIGWRWAFWINIPLGLLAIASAMAFLHLRKPNLGKPRIDYLGMVLVATAATCLILFTTWGGNTYAWGSAVIIGLIVGCVVTAVAFVFVEKRADEPVIPMHLFAQRNFVLTTVGLIIGIAMFGALAYLPTYIQMVTGKNATEAGLMMIPMMAGLLVASIGSGQLVSKTAATRSSHRRNIHRRCCSGPALTSDAVDLTAGLRLLHRTHGYRTRPRHADLDLDRAEHLPRGRSGNGHRVEQLLPPDRCVVGQRDRGQPVRLASDQSPGRATPGEWRARSVVTRTH